MQCESDIYEKKKKTHTHTRRHRGDTYAEQLARRLYE